jgi:hypothetical protein
MTVYKKADYVKGLAILFDLPKDAKKDIEKLSVGTLAMLFEGQKKNALAFQELKASSARNW